MSMGYAEKLSFQEDVGNVGMCEIFDPPDVFQRKIEELALMIQKSKHLVVFTGAGISTSCGIPDFRGPKGVWTLQSEGKGVPKASLPFHRAMPSLTHMALVEWEKVGILKFVISQNVDSLHLRSGIPREKIAELHGNSFMELCPSCETEYLRDFEVETIGLKETSRRCADITCGTKLKDTVLDWEDPLSTKEMNLAEKHCEMSDLVLCLGTSLQVTPACNLPLKAIAGGGKMVIVNLQETPKDKKASLVIHGQVDEVILGVMQFLDLRIPPYIHVDLVQINLSHFPKAAEPNKKLRQLHKFNTIKCIGKRNINWSLRVTSVHGPRAPLPFVKSVKVLFPERPDLKTAVLDKPPFTLIRETSKKRPFKMLVVLNYGDGCGCSSTEIEWPVDFQVSVKPFNHGKDAVFKKLRDTAIQDSCCGQFAEVERVTIPKPRCHATVYAIVTNHLRYNASDANGKSKIDKKIHGRASKKSLNGGTVNKKSTKRLKRP